MAGAKDLTKEPTTDADGERKTPRKLTPVKLELKKTVETGQVRQSFSHGRSKAVTVEVRKKRTFAPTAGGVLKEVKETLRAPEHEVAAGARRHGSRARPSARSDRPARKPPAPARCKTRARPNTETQRVDDETKRHAATALAAEETARTRPARRPGERPMLATAAPSDAAPVTAEVATDGKAAAPTVKAKPGAPLGPRPVVVEEDEEGPARPRRAAAHRPAAGAASATEPRRREGKLTVTAALDENDRSERGRSLAAVKRARERERQKQLGSADREGFARSHHPRSHHGAGTRQPHGRARRRRHQDADEAWA